MENRFNYLMLSFIALFVIGPVAEMYQIKFPIGALIFLGAILLTLRSVLTNNKSFYGTACLAVIAFVFTFIAQTQTSSASLGIIGSCIYIVFIIASMVILTKRLLTEKHIKADTIKGGVCVYFLMGFLWTLFYGIVYQLDPNAFSFGNIGVFDYQHFNYYSFTALTTLGFGDITPINPLARNLTTLEAILGQLFLAVFIARLIGLYIAQELKK